ncbi:MAG: hypothetical protein GY928_30650 [Colwellia sp.]|nr:hypothetical protein [Colwellia sp.]
METLAKKDDNDLPGIGISLLPIILPIILIAGKTLYCIVLQGCQNGTFGTFWRADSVVTEISANQLRHCGDIFRGGGSGLSHFFHTNFFFPIFVYIHFFAKGSI